jgi:hypothetical protein
MMSFRNIFLLTVVIASGQSLYAQYDKIFKTPFPEQIRLLDSVLIRLSTIDSATLYNEFGKIRAAAAKSDDYTRLNVERAILSVKTDSNYEAATAESNGKKIIDQAMKINAPEIAASQYQTLGYYYELKTRSFGKAFENYLKAFELLDKIPIEKLPTRLYAQYMVSMSYYHYNDFENALKLSLRTDKSFIVKTFVYVFNRALIGLCYMKTGQYDSARIYFQYIFDNANLMASERSWKGIALGNIGRTYFFQNNFEKATGYLMQAIPLTIEGNVYDNTVPFASDLSSIFLKENDLPDAKKFLDIMLDAANKAGDEENYFIAYNTAASYYRSANKLPLALLYSDSAEVFNKKLAVHRDLNTKYKIEMAVQAEEVREREKLFTQEKQRQLLLRNAIIAFVVLVMIISLLLYNRSQLKSRHRQQQLISEKQLAETELQSATQQLNAFTQSIREKNELIEKASQEIEKVNAELDLAKDQLPRLPAAHAIDSQALHLMQNAVLLTDEDWKNFTQLFEKVHQGFFYNLKAKLPGLSPAEIRFITLVRLRLSNKEMANMLGISTDAIRQMRSRLRKKLNLGENEVIEEVVESI